MKRKWICFIVILAVAVLIGFKPVSAAIAEKAAQDALVSDLAVLSGLTEAEVWHLDYLIEDLEGLRENIFIYREIISKVKTAVFNEAELEQLIKSNEPLDILTVFQYLEKSGMDLRLASGILSGRKPGSALEELLYQAESLKVYKNYVPADEEQIREWLRAGLLPEDILMADEIARDIDAGIAQIVEMKTAETEWRLISEKLGSTAGDNPAILETAKLSVKTDGQIIIFEAKSFMAAVDSANLGLKPAMDKGKALLKANLPVPVKETDLYLAQGFNLNEINNAARLSLESGIAIDRILAEKKAGSDWESLILKYHKPEKETI